MAIDKPFFLRNRMPAMPVTSSSAALSPTQVAFACNDEPGLVWRTASLSAFLVLDMGTAISAQAFALLWTNLRSTDTVRWRAAASEADLTASPLFDSTALPAFSGTLLNDIPSKHLFTADEPVTARWWRIDIAAASHPSGFVQVGRVLIGAALTLADDFDTDAGQTIHDDSVVDEGPGYEDVEQYQALPGWECTFSWVSGAAYRQWLALVKDIGQARPVLFVPEPYAPEQLQDSAVFGRLRKTEFRHPIHDGWTVQVAIKSLHP